MNRSLEVELQSLRDADGNASATPSSSIGQQPPPLAPPPPAAAAPPVPALPLARIPLRVRLWRLLEEPSDSILGSAIALVVVASVLLSITAFVVQSLPQYVFSDAPVWPAIELTCIVIFTAEYCTRLACCPDVRAFLVAPLNIVDLISLLPFYIELIAGGTFGGSSGAGVVRILRLVRVFRVFKVARYLPWVRVFSAALAASVQPLLMLVLIILIGVVIFGSLMYYAERGEWDAAAQAWIRVDEFGATGPSPFSSIPACMWWAVITMTTVGYGDMFPVTTLGRAIAASAALCGVLVIAVPITIISTNFNAEAARLEAERARVRARMTLLQRHFAAKRAGLDAVLDEVDDIVRRNAQELETEVAALLEATRAELTTELQELVRMAYERRRVLHLRALARRAAAAGGGGAAGAAAGAAPATPASAR